jgi:uncharacterized protein (DUF2252 family)
MNTTAAASGVLDAVLHFNRDRKPALLEMKLRKMRADPFTFFRGADHLFCRAWPELRPIDPGPDVLICADLHLENFGAYRTIDGHLHYDINDFDEAIVAPCGFDLVRCATSIILASEQWRLTPSQATGMALSYLEHYRKAVGKVIEDGSIPDLTPHGGRGPIQEILGDSALATQAELLAAKTRRKSNGLPAIRRTANTPEISRKQLAKVAEALESHGRRLGKPDGFKVHDVTFRIAGVGSLGVRRYLALVEGNGPPDKYELLDIKEASPSAAAVCAAAWPAPGVGDADSDEARRVVTAQTILQGHVAIGLDALKIGPRAYRVRQMIPAENRSSLERFREQPNRLLKAVETAGHITARSHLRGARFRPGFDRWTDLARWAQGPSFEALLAAAARFTVRTNREHQAFKKAIRQASGVSACLAAATG